MCSKYTFMPAYQLPLYTLRTGVLTKFGTYKLMILQLYIMIRVFKA